MAEIQTGYEHSYALVVGINSYSDPRFVPLGNAEADADAFAALLKAPPFDFEVTQLCGTDATRQAILSALFKLRLAESGDRVLVYFAGHGYTLGDRFGGEAGYLAAADTTPEQDFTALEMEEVTGLIKHAKAKHIAFIFDACFSGQALGLTRAPAVAAEKYMERRAFQVISAGAGDQVVSDFHSMTSSLINALESGTTSRDGLVTFSELGLYLQQTIAADSGHTQIPQFGHLRGSQGGDFIFMQDIGPRLPTEIDEALRSSRSNTRLGAAVDLIDIASTGADIDVGAIARERLKELADTDPDERVRAAAQSFFDERAAGPGENAAEQIERSRRARQIGPESTGIQDSEPSVLKPARIESAPASPATKPSPGSTLQRYALPAGIGIGVLALIIVAALIFRQIANLSGSETLVAGIATQANSAPDGTSSPAVIEVTPIGGEITPTAVPLPVVLLDVPYISGRDEQPASANASFGPTCLAMLLRAAGTPFPVDDLFVANGNAARGPLLPSEMIDIPDAMGIEMPLSLSENTAPEDVKAALDAGQAVILYVDYQRIFEAKLAPAAPVSSSSTVADLGLAREQYVVLVGYDETGAVYVHDPAWTSTGGQSYRWPAEAFEAAWDNPDGGFNRLVLVPSGQPTNAQVDFQPTVEGITADGFDSPVGTEEERRSDQIWPGEWFDAMGFATFYNVPGPTYATGVQLNLPDEADAGAPIYSPASGVVVYAAKASGTWGNVIVIRHDPLADGTAVWTRYGGVGDILVTTGDRVERGQQITSVGNSDGRFSYHLHFDIAITNILEVNPSHWPGARQDLVLKNYTDPKAFIEAHRPQQ